MEGGDQEMVHSELIEEKTLKTLVSETDVQVAVVPISKPDMNEILEVSSNESVSEEIIETLDFFGVSTKSFLSPVNDLSRTSSVMSELKIEDEKSQSKIPKKRQMVSESKSPSIRGVSRPGSVKPGSSQISIASVKKTQEPISRSLPHAPGALPKCILNRNRDGVKSVYARPETARNKKPDVPFMRSATMATINEPPLTTVIQTLPNKAEDHEKLIQNLKMKATIHQKKSVGLAKEVEELKAKLEAAESNLASKQQHLQEKNDKIKAMDVKFKKEMCDLKNNSTRTEDFVQLENTVKQLKTELEQRVAQISSLKNKLMNSEVENRSLKTQSTEVLKTKKKESMNDTENLKRELHSLKVSEQQLQQDLQTLKSKLEDSDHKNYRIENLLQLRGEYIKTLQDADEVNKARLILQVKDIEDLRYKMASAKKFKQATREELENLHNTMKNQEIEIEKLRYQIEQKDQKLTKYKNRCQRFEMETR